MSKAVNASILNQLDSRQITSATLLMNAPAVEEAAYETKRYPRISFGVHLNSTQFAPLRRQEGLTTLLDDQGNFRSDLRKLRLTSGVREAIFDEWCAQVLRAIELGVSVSHLDSHNHVHTVPSLFLVLKRVQIKFGIRRVRIARNIYHKNEPTSVRLLAAKSAWNFALRNIYRTR